MAKHDEYFPDDPPQEKQQPPPEEKPRKKYSTPDGPRYAVALQTEKDPSCFKDFFESEKLNEAKDEAKKALEESARSVMIFDRENHVVLDRLDPPKAEPIVEKKKKK